MALPLPHDFPIPKEQRPSRHVVLKNKTGLGLGLGINGREGEDIVSLEDPEDPPNMDGHAI